MKSVSVCSDQGAQILTGEGGVGARELPQPSNEFTVANQLDLEAHMSTGPIVAILFTTGSINAQLLGTFAPTSHLTTERTSHTATLLTTGKSSAAAAAGLPFPGRLSGPAQSFTILQEEFSALRGA